jgi:P pilus assembly chaperone PapD
MKLHAALIPCLLVGQLCLGFSAYAQPISGVQPEASVLLISETEGQAQMGVKNTDPNPLLLYVKVYDVSEDKELRVIPIPAVTRVEAGGRQIVRFVLENPSKPLAVQHFKRVTFEGVPSKSTNPDEAGVRVNVRYDLPIVISPKGLKSVDDPWTLMAWKIDSERLTVHNPSPYVVRMSREVDLLPAIKRVEIAKRTFILPGETLSIELPGGISAESVKGVRLFPATLYGSSAPDFDASIQP